MSFWCRLDVLIELLAVTAFFGSVFGMVWQARRNNVAKDYFDQLCLDFPPRRIENDEQFKAYQLHERKISDQQFSRGYSDETRDMIEYRKLLGVLIADYRENRNTPDNV